MKVDTHDTFSWECASWQKMHDSQFTLCVQLRNPDSVLGAVMAVVLHLLVGGIICIGTQLFCNLLILPLSVNFA